LVEVVRRANVNGITIEGKGGTVICDQSDLKAGGFWRGPE